MIKLSLSLKKRSKLLDYVSVTSIDDNGIEFAITNGYEAGDEVSFSYPPHPIPDQFIFFVFFNFIVYVFLLL